MIKGGSVLLLLSLFLAYVLAPAVDALCRIVRPGPRRRSPAGGLSDGRLGGGLSGVWPGGGRPPARCGPATAACGP